jgi:hypothetical protein
MNDDDDRTTTAFDNANVIYTHRETYRGYRIECFRDGEKHGASISPGKRFVVQANSVSRAHDLARGEVNRRIARRKPLTRLA